MFTDKVLMITGGTGSFGNAVLKRFIDTDLREIRIFSRDEKKQEEMRHAYNNSKLKFYIGDVRDINSVKYAMTGVDFVFHAAALKQVPSCEFFPMEAVNTNILGTNNVVDAAASCGVSKVVLLSTDKAVYPINAMGISKAMAEKVVVSKALRMPEGGPVISATRYGNVMGSRGSVIPLFKEQIKSGKPLTITDPNMTRFLMSLEDSVDLVLHAFSNANQGDIFVQKAPASTVADLAQAMLNHYGADNAVRTIGTRHGEKLFETLVAREEMAKADDMGRYYRIPADSRDLNYQNYFVQGEESISLADDYTSHNTDQLSISEIEALLFKTNLL